MARINTAYRSNVWVLSFCKWREAFMKGTVYSLKIKFFHEISPGAFIVDMQTYLFYDRTTIEVAYYFKSGGTMTFHLSRIFHVSFMKTALVQHITQHTGTSTLNGLSDISNQFQASMGGPKMGQFSTSTLNRKNEMHVFGDVNSPYSHSPLF